jgi:hypothetical protein
MNAKLLRNWSAGFGAAALAAAVAMAALWGHPEPAAPKPAPKPAPEHAAPLAPAPALAPAPQSQAPAKAPAPLLAEPAEAPAPEIIPDQAGFLVRFAQSDPLSAAQSLAGAGREDDARRLVEQELANRRDLRGLCFGRFTLGGAEIVLVACASLSERQRERFRARWNARFARMQGVEYAEPNMIAEVESKPGR